MLSFAQSEAEWRSVPLERMRSSCGICRKPEAAEVNLLAAESIIGNAVGTDNDYMKTTYRYLNNLYARWKKPEKAIEYRAKFLGVKQSVLKQLE